MRKRKRLIGTSRLLAPNALPIALSITLLTLISLSPLIEIGPSSSLLLLLDTHCLSNSPQCNCTWKGGKFVADCSQQNLNQVPKNDYFDYLLSNSGNNQMPTLNRDIQQLSLTSNNITTLRGAEFFKKKFRNLQKIYLNTNQLFRIHSSAFYKMTGLIELDLSENMISSFYGNNNDVDRDDDNYGDNNNENSISESDDSKSSGDRVGFDDGRAFVGVASGEMVNRTNNNESNSSSNKTSKTTDDEFQGNKKRPRRGRRRRTFLQDLSQLRQLNLASNQLRTIEKFTFGPLIQLRQLILSKNQISFIDERAFNGLNLLNILHLDGNKLSHLDGDLLLRMPKLYAIQLGGSANRWRCDCRLRRLVRSLMPRSQGRGAPNLQELKQKRKAAEQHQQGDELNQLTRGANILQDEPICFDHQQYHETSFGERVTVDQDQDTARSGDFIVRANDGWNNNNNNSGTNDDTNNDDVNDDRLQSQPSSSSSSSWAPNHQMARQEHRRRAWRSVKLTEFECPPRLASQFMIVQSTSTTIGTEANHHKPIEWPSTTNAQILAKNNDSPSDMMMSTTIVSATATASSSLDSRQQQPQEVMNMNDKRNTTTITNVMMTGGHQQQQRQHQEEPQTIVPGAFNSYQQQQHYLVGEPIELTCAFHLTDELDLEQVQVEWWQVEASSSSHHHHLGAKSSLLWRSSDATTTGQPPSPPFQQATTRASQQSGMGSKGLPTMPASDDGPPPPPPAGMVVAQGDRQKKQPIATSTVPSSSSSSSTRLGKRRQQSRQDYAIIDYVTRANQSDPRHRAWKMNGRKESEVDEEEEKGEEEEGEEAEMEMDKGATTLIRVSHLLINENFHNDRDGSETTTSADSNNDKAARLFLCRITNKVGQLEVLYSLHIDSGSDRAKLEFRRRQNLRRRLLLDETSGGAKFPPNWLPGLTDGGWPLERAQAALAEVLARGGNKSSVGPLFIPLHLPEGLAGSKWPPQPLRHDDGGGGDDMDHLLALPNGPAQFAGASGSVARSLPGSIASTINPQGSSSHGDHQSKPAARHTNASITTATNSNGAASTPTTSVQVSNSTLTARVSSKQMTTHQGELAGDNAIGIDSTFSQQQQHRGGQIHNQYSAPNNRRPAIESLALSLIGRYTSNKRSLVFGTDDNLGDEGGPPPNVGWTSSSSGQQLSAGVGVGLDSAEELEPSVADGRFRSLLKLAYSRFLDKWVQMAIGEAPLLLGICAGLLVGCLMTTLLVFRLRCANNRTWPRSADAAAAASAHSNHKPPPPPTPSAGHSATNDDDGGSSSDIMDNGTHDRGMHERDAGCDVKENGFCNESPQSVRFSKRSCMDPSGSGGKSTSAGSSSNSTTNGSQRKLICSPGPATIEACQGLRFSLVEGQAMTTRRGQAHKGHQSYDRFMMETSCQSEEGEGMSVNCAMDAANSITSLHVYSSEGACEGGSNPSEPLTKTYLSSTLRSNCTRQRSNNPQRRTSGARRLIVFDPQQQHHHQEMMQELSLNPELPYYPTTNTLEDHQLLMATTFSSGATTTTTDFTGSGSGDSPPIYSFNNNSSGGASSQLHCEDLAYQLQEVPNFVYNQPMHNHQWLTGCELEEATLEAADSSSPSVMLSNHSQQQQQQQQPFIIHNHQAQQQLQSRRPQKTVSAQKRSVATDSLGDRQQDPLLELLPSHLAYLPTTSDYFGGVGGQISNMSGHIAQHHTQSGYADIYLGQNQTLHRQSSMMNNQRRQQQQVYNLLPAPSSSITSPIPSTSSSLTINPIPLSSASSSNHQQTKCFIRDTSDPSMEEDEADISCGQNNSFVYLDDALQLLQTSMTDCLLSGNHTNELNNKRL